MTTKNILYRGVRWKQLPSKIEDVSYPPAIMAKLGRANREGLPMFYASRAPFGVFYELRAERGDLIALSEWEVTEPLWMHNLGFHQDALRQIGASDGLVRSRSRDPIPNETKRHAKLRRQLSMAFTEDIQEGHEYRYKQSIAINELLFGDPAPIRPRYSDGPRRNETAGTVYPAVQMRGAADNVVMFPKFVDSCLRLKFVRYVLVEASDKARSYYSFKTIAMSRAFAEHDIIWQDKLPSERIRRSSIALEGSHWIVRDGLHRIYDAHGS